MVMEDSCKASRLLTGVPTDPLDTSPDRVVTHTAGRPPADLSHTTLPPSPPNVSQLTPCTDHSRKPSITSPYSGLFGLPASASAADTLRPDTDTDSSARPRLRKVPKLSFDSTVRNGPDHAIDCEPAPISMRKLAALSKTYSVPSFHAARDADDSHRPTSSGGDQPPTTPLFRTNSHPLQRSPGNKKPPASHSSYGVETTLGPPPSYSTQRTLSQDRLRPPDRPSTTSAARTAKDSERDQSPSKSNVNESSLPDPTVSQGSPAKQLSADSRAEASSDEAISQPVSSPETIDAESIVTPSSSMSRLPLGTPEAAKSNDNEDPMQSLKVNAPEDDGKGSSSDERKSEDLFLNIARATAAPSARTDKRRSRISLPFFPSTTRPSSSYKSSPIQERFDTTSVSGRSEAIQYYSKRASLGQHAPGAMPQHPEPEGSVVGDLLSERDTARTQPTDYTQRASSRRHSNADRDSTKPLSRPSTARTSRLASEYHERQRLGEHNATESTISTTAPSTVWDELDDLKSRIRKLELTGKLPPSSAAAMSTSERPKTANTAATTISSSPKHKAASPHLQSAIEGIPSTVHPNLHEALGNAKTQLSNDIYQKLQATAQDALQLSLMMNPEGYSGPGSTVGANAVTERQVRRRAESMCRSLTELAIAILAENKQPSGVATRPASRDAYQPSSIGVRSRRYSNEPNDRPPVTSRVQSRLETRRTSVPLGATLGNQNSPETNSTFQTPPTALPQIQSTSSSRLGRTSTLMRSRRTAGYLDGTDDEESSPSVRPVSRAMTEVGTFRSARDRAAFSREYTSHHPMPTTAVAVPSSLDIQTVTRSPMPANVSANLVPRRKFAAPASAVGTGETTPSTPKEPWGRISIVPAVASSPVEVSTPESQVGIRPSYSRRSLGFASRISSVSSRLRAAKAERNTATRDLSEIRLTKEGLPLGQEAENMSPEQNQQRNQ